MNFFFSLIKLDYLQRTRSNAFLVVLCASLAIAYTFVPEPNANYSTLRIADYVGFYNSAWFGYVTAIMCSVFLSLIGFYLVNSGLKNDHSSRVGQIIGSSPISNFKYLLSKVLSNFLILLTIVLAVILMSVVLFVLYNDGYSFEFNQFLTPYLFITLPALFFVSILAVLFEVILHRYSVVQSIAYFFLFATLLLNSNELNEQHKFDVFGTKIVIYEMKQAVKEITKSDEEIGLNIGYVITNRKQFDKFEFKGVDFPRSYLLSRLLWGLLGISIIAAISPFFHRFNLKERLLPARKLKVQAKINLVSKELDLEKLPKLNPNYDLLPLVKTEILLIIRKGKKWMWAINLAGMVLLALLPLKIAHQIVLPILWFLQVNRISDIITKETTHKIHYLTFSAYHPIKRILVSQVISAIILMLFLSLPILIREASLLHLTETLAITFGAFIIVLLSCSLGILSKGTKLFEVLFFMLSYANINGVITFDYYGGWQHQQSYLMVLGSLILILASVVFLIRSSQLKKL